MRRFHLLSLLVAMLTASVLIGVNVRGSWRPVSDAPINGVTQGKWDYGWPAAVYSYDATIAFWKDVRPELRPTVEAFVAQQEKLTASGKGPAGTFLRKSEGIYALYRDPRFTAWAIGANAGILLGLSALALFACESILRRRESRADASRRSPTAT